MEQYLINCLRNAAMRQALVQRRGMSGFRVWLIVAMLGLTGCEIMAQSPYQLKAAVLGNLAKFVEWPASSFSTPADPILVGILGEDPFGPDLETILQPITVKGRKIAVLRSRKLEDLLTCQILFCQLSDPDELKNVISRIQQRPILLVGEHPRFLELGGMVNFHMEDRKVRFAINEAAAVASQLSMHPQLLKLATTVKRKGRSE
jgi:hypothetical protein